MPESIFGDAEKGDVASLKASGKDRKKGPLSGYDGKGCAGPPLGARSSREGYVRTPLRAPKLERKKKLWPESNCG